MKTQQSLLLVFYVAVLAVLSQTSPALADRRIALVIGNGGYNHTPSLSNPPNDARDVAQSLKAIGFDVTLRVDVDKRQMDEAIAQFAREGRAADAVLFYYAGHGMQFEGKNYLMPVDARLQDEVSLRYEMVGLDDVKSAMQISPGVKIMVLDACRNNPLADKFVRSISVSARDVPRVQGYARLEKAQGMIIVYATQADDVAQDGTGRNSPFSAAFLKEIKEPGLEVGAMFRASAAMSMRRRTAANRLNCRSRWCRNITSTSRRPTRRSGRASGRTRVRRRCASSSTATRTAFTRPTRALCSIF